MEIVLTLVENLMRVGGAFLWGIKRSGRVSCLTRKYYKQPSTFPSHFFFLPISLIQDKVAELALLVAEVAEDTADLTEALVAGFTVKQPKTALACVAMATQLVSEFGAKVVDPKPLLKVRRSPSPRRCNRALVPPDT